MIGRCSKRGSCRAEPPALDFFAMTAMQAGLSGDQTAAHVRSLSSCFAGQSSRYLSAAPDTYNEQSVRQSKAEVQKEDWASGGPATTIPAGEQSRLSSIIAADCTSNQPRPKRRPTENDSDHNSGVGSIVKCSDIGHNQTIAALEPCYTQCSITTSWIDSYCSSVCETPFTPDYSGYYWLGRQGTACGGS